MPFFQTVDSLGIVENHIQDLMGLEENQAKRLLRRYREARRELRDRLDRLPRGSFTAQQLSGTLAQVEAGIAAMSQGLIDGMREVAPETALSGVEDLLSEIRVFEDEFTGAVTPINLQTQLIADDTANFLFNRYEASLAAYSEGIRSGLANELTMSALMNTSLSKSVADINQRVGMFFAGEEWKLFRIARTEMASIYNVGKMNGMTATRDAYLPDLKKTLIHPMDSRTGEDSKALARENPIIPITEPFRQKWKGKEFVFMAPPNRPNDRAVLVPYRDVWNQTL